MGREDRRKVLKAKWKFNCECQLCSKVDEELQENENRKKQIQKYHQDVAMYAEKSDTVNALLSAIHKLNLMLTRRGKGRQGSASRPTNVLSTVSKQLGTGEKIVADTYRQKAYELAVNMGDSYMYSYHKKQAKINRYYS